MLIQRDWDTMRHWIHNKTKNSPHLELQVLAKTYQKREVIGLKISTGRGKPVIVVVGAEVGRDWITTAIILNYINHLLTHAQTDKLVEHYDFYFIPVANPDGYVYSFEQDRIWAKNRVEFETGIKCTSGHLPVGLNIDRNWFFFPKLIRQNECLGVFGGHQTISEKETRAMKEILNNCSSNLIAFINLRGFSRLITIPYANAQYVSNNYDLMIEILSAVTDKLRENHNAHYYYGSTARLFYNYTGNCADWVKVKLNVPIVYTIYLQLDENVFPDPTHIVPLVQQFSAILTNTMAIAGNIYGPLFNSYPKNTSSILIFIAFYVSVI
ncbi:zinc carboxypeptidase-like isoform X2 [Hyposmocoma kahamanoa]|uniref:zinc carboxypeptidase-like isoform X2 n=1 Tax=Hyposmocoma kahamanoa TaxID=1477025 RepID=UPI000E6D78BC|nr:zinc carboxypeptidase-like isoform X2 [Hyposmocoma kahamanoa]